MIHHCGVSWGEPEWPANCWLTNLSQHGTQQNL